MIHVLDNTFEITIVLSKLKLKNFQIKNQYVIKIFYIIKSFRQIFPTFFVNFNTKRQQSVETGINT